MLSIIIPTLNAATSLEATLSALEAPGIETQVIISDGGSSDGTQGIATQRGALLIEAPTGRGAQLAEGAKAATRPWLLFLHADTRLDAGWQSAVETFISKTEEAPKAAVFKFALNDPNPAARRLEKIVAWRCRWLGLPYGDQGLLISRAHYDQIDGFRELPLYEDVDIIRRLGHRNITYLETAAITSASRYRQSGYILQPLRNAACLSLYFVGLPPHLIGRLYQ